MCHKIDNKTVQGLPHMECEVTGRPCCIGTQAQCIITSQDYCKFKGGFYHKDKTLCSQVTCQLSISENTEIHHFKKQLIECEPSFILMYLLRIVLCKTPLLFRLIVLKQLVVYFHLPTKINQINFTGFTFLFF